jgi:hypothetical protein
LQILLQPALAPQLHACFDHCHALQKAHATAHGCCGKEDCGGSKKSPNSDSHSHHNCTSCPICDVLTAPRVPAVICSLQLVTLLTRLDPAAAAPRTALCMSCNRLSLLTLIHARPCRYSPAAKCDAFRCLPE